MDTVAQATGGFRARAYWSDIKAKIVTGTKLGEAPVYLLGVNGTDETPISMASFSPLLSDLEDSFFFINPMRAFCFPAFLKAVVTAINSAHAAYPRHTFTVLVNDENDVSAVREALSPDIPVFVCGEHSLVDIDLYDYTDTAIKYGAVYNTQDHPVKRIGLARKIDSLCLVSKNITAEAEAEYRRTFPRFHCPNFDNGNYVKLSPSDVSRYLNSSGCGLILSEKEGQNRATIEYLLCGLPVVTTPSLGGRSRFLTPANSIIATPDEDAVRDAALFAASHFDRQKIAEDTRDMVRRERRWLHHIVNTVMERKGLRSINVMHIRLPNHAFSHAQSLNAMLA